MTTPTGQISLSQVNAEIARTSTTSVDFDLSDVRALAGQSTGAISASQLRGKNWTVDFGTDGLTSHTFSSINTTVTVHFSFTQTGGTGQYQTLTVWANKNGTDTTLYNGNAPTGNAFSIAPGDVVYFHSNFRASDGFIASVNMTVAVLNGSNSDSTFATFYLTLYDDRTGAPQF